MIALNISERLLQQLEVHNPKALASLD